MSADVEFVPHLIMKDKISTSEHNRRNSWNNSSSLSASAASWLERKLFSHFKYFFRRTVLSSTSSSSSSNGGLISAVENVTSLPVTRQSEDKKQEQQHEIEQSSLSSSSISAQPIADPVDLLYDYDRLLARCIERQERDRTEMLLRCQTPISIPHAVLLVGQSGTILFNWKVYTRLFHELKRDPHLFQQYINEYYSCQSLINQREQLTLNIRTTKVRFDNVLKKFLGDYVTCLICQTAQTHLIKSGGLWRIECQLCGTQRTVKRLRWKTYHR